ncbi:hypothetical protein MHYP_G00082020 [Metynnis hypsauchen]
MMYLGVSNNNLASATLALFKNAVQRIERLWRDVFTAVTSHFYNILHELEDEGHLNLSNSPHIFCCHYAFIPCLQAHLDILRDGWDNHPICTEGNHSPNQLWHLGQQYHSQESDENLNILQIDWESSGLMPSDSNSSDSNAH